jgi:hypothetical protein
MLCATSLPRTHCITDPTRRRTFDTCRFTNGVHISGVCCPPHFIQPLCPPPFRKPHQQACIWPLRTKDRTPAHETPKRGRSGFYSPRISFTECPAPFPSPPFRKLHQRPHI